VDGVAAQLSGTDYHLAIFADVKTEQKIKIEGADSEDEADEDDAVQDTTSSVATGATGPRSSSKEIKDVTVPFSSTSGLANSQFTPLGHFSWKDEAEATSTITVVNTIDPSTGGIGRRKLQVTQTIKVIATVPSDQVDQKHQTVAFSFTGPGSIGADYIHWDPEAGVGYLSSSASWRAGWMSLTAVMVAAVSLML
jgi:hypothetical protein